VACESGHGEHSGVGVLRGVRREQGEEEEEGEGEGEGEGRIYLLGILKEVCKAVSKDHPSFGIGVDNSDSDSGISHDDLICNEINKKKESSFFKFTFFQFKPPGEGSGRREEGERREERGRREEKGGKGRRSCNPTRPPWNRSPTEICEILTEKKTVARNGGKTKTVR
jgi:hypothetical protein